MPIHFVLLILLAGLSLRAGTIDSGVIITPNVPNGFLGSWSLQSISSTSPDYSVSGVIGGGLFSTMTGSCLTLGGCSSGTAGALIAFVDPDTSGSGTATVNSVSSAVSLLTASGAPFANTTLLLSSSSFVVSGPGAYAVQFTMSGRIEAKNDLANPNNFVVNDLVTGAGTVTFDVSQLGPGLYGIADRGPVTWTFVPEPASLSLLALGLALLVKISRTRPDRRHRLT